jgi:hypothetical protein
MHNIKVIVFAVIIAFIGQKGANATDSNLKPKYGGFISVNAGNFTLSFPNVTPAATKAGYDYGFEDVYGSNYGTACGFEAGVGKPLVGLYFVTKARFWKKEGNVIEIGDASFDGDLTWSQNTYSMGARYWINDKSKPRQRILPFIGGGFVFSQAKEKAIGYWTSFGIQEFVNESEEVSGTGFYLEGGADWFLTPSVSLRGFVEYSKLTLKNETVDPTLSIDGGGGIYAGMSVSIFLGQLMK